MKVDFSLALAKIDSLCEDALASGKHTEGDWKELAPSGNLRNAKRHLDLVHTASASNYSGDEGEDHLLNATCRLLMALQLREELKNAR